jgi:hypothetical protein
MTQMAIHEKVLSHSVSVFHGNVSPNDYLIRLTLEFSGRAEIFFKKDPPFDAPTFANGVTVAQMPDSQFEHAYHLLQTESPVFFSALDLFGLTIVNLTTDPDLSGLIAAVPNNTGVEDRVLEFAKVIEASRKK